MYRIPSSVDPQPDPLEFREGSASQTPATRKHSSVSPLETILLDATRIVSADANVMSQFTRARCETLCYCCCVGRRQIFAFLECTSSLANLYSFITYLLIHKNNQPSRIVNIDAGCFKNYQTTTARFRREQGGQQPNSNRTIQNGTI